MRWTHLSTWSWSYSSLSSHLHLNTKLQWLSCLTFIRTMCERPNPVLTGFITHPQIIHPAFEAWFTEVTFLSYNSNPFSQALPPAVTLRRRRHDRVNVSLWTGLPASKLKWLPARCELQVNLLSVRGEYRGCALLIMLSRGEATVQKGREKQKTRRKNERGALVRVTNMSESHKTSQDHDQFKVHSKIKCERQTDRQTQTDR